jgi:hypothetical protein
MIQFRCWYCHRRYSVPESNVHQRLTCGGCKNVLRVPKRSGGNCRVKTLMDWAVETILYGGGGALLGFGLAVLILSQWRVPFFPERWILIPGLSLLGFLAGAFGGERGVIWIGHKIRDRETR